MVRLTERPDMITAVYRGLKTYDGWMICNFTSFLTVFQLYQDDERLIMKGCVQWNPVYG